MPVSFPGLLLGKGYLLANGNRNGNGNGEETSAKSIGKL